MSSRLLLILVFLWAGCSSDPAGTPTNNDPDPNPDTGRSDASTDMGDPEPDADPCEPADEVCDGEDNDCDGDVDEDFDVETSCRVGLGVCAVDGVNVCDAMGTGVVCDAEPLEPTQDELCGDDLDNDCDGAIDEDFNLGDACTSGLGVCEVDGVLVCDATTGAAVCDAAPLDPPEDPDEITCDALDNDCDGDVDEGCDDDGDEFCDAAFTLVSPAGDALCANGDGDCDDEDAEVYPGAPGLCDGKDNDCADGIDDIKRATTTLITMQNVFADASSENSPVQAVGAGDGFCFIVSPPLNAPGSDGAEGFFDAASAQPIFISTGSTGVLHLAGDIDASAPGRCASLRVVDGGGGTRSATITSFSYDFASLESNAVVNDDITHISPSWDVALGFQNDTWVVGWSDTAGSTGSYVSLPVNFNSTTTPDGPFVVGNNGTFPEFGLHPSGQGFLFATNFFNINVRELTVGAAATAVASLGIPSSVNRSSLIMNQVGADHWFALRHDGTVDAWEIRRISSNLTYDLAGAVTYATALEAQEYISRNAFVGGPSGQTWFLDTVDEEFVAISDNGAGGLDVVEMADVIATGQLLTGRQVSTDVTELLWLTEPGDANADIEFEIATYTCH